MKLRRSWRAKLANSKDLPRVETITGKMSTRWGTGTVVIPAPLEVDELMRRVPKGTEWRLSAGRVMCLFFLQVMTRGSWAWNLPS